jgi:hypothetical protein
MAKKKRKPQTSWIEKRFLVAKGFTRDDTAAALLVLTEVVSDKLDYLGFTAVQSNDATEYGLAAVAQAVDAASRR